MRANRLFGRTGSREVSAELDALRRDLNRVRGDLRDLLEAVMGVGRENAEAAGDRLRERARRLADAARRRKDEGIESLGERVGERPLATIGSAFAAGLVIAGVVALLATMTRR